MSDGVLFYAFILCFLHFHSRRLFIFFRCILSSWCNCLNGSVIISFRRSRRRIIVAWFYFVTEREKKEEEEEEGKTAMHKQQNEITSKQKLFVWVVINRIPIMRRAPRWKQEMRLFLSDKSNLIIFFFSFSRFIIVCSARDKLSFHSKIENHCCHWDWLLCWVVNDLDRI